jgi:serine/threonine protein phosphatase PrpC
MDGYKSFAVTVLGGSHVKSGTVCQDASCFFDNGDGKDKDDKKVSVSIAVVADGHGDPSCFRSDKGSTFAVACARSGIWNFVKEQESLFKESFLKKSDPPSHRELEKLIREKLIKQTVASWNMQVMEDYQKNPFTPEELKGAGDKYRERYSPDYKGGKHMNHAYGTSLIAVAITPWYWFAYHVGDGRFTVLNEDSSGAQPVPWDPKCFLNVTTSLCDEDILSRKDVEKEGEGVRLYLSLHSEKAPPVAFFCCSDGIDDNYPVDEKENAECLYRLYREIAVTFAEDGYDSTCGQDGKSGQIKDLANGYATRGKGDDTSLAGIVNIEKLKEVAPAWKEKMKADEAEREKAKADEKARIKAEAEEREKEEAKKAARRAEIEAQAKAENEAAEKAKAEARAKAEAEKKTAAEKAKAEAEAKTKPVFSPYEATGGTPKPGSSPTGDKVKEAEAEAAKAKAEYEAAAAKARAEYEAAAAKARAAEAAAERARAEASGQSENPDSKADKEQVAIRVINERQRELLLGDKKGADEAGSGVDVKA